MSYIITTSDQDEYNFNGTGIERPYSYHNHMSQPVVIPANGKIAVQSVKINRDPTFELTDGRRWFGYMLMGKSFDIDYPELDEYQTYVPAVFEVAPGSYSVSQLAVAINDAFTRAQMYHPDMAKTITTVNTDSDGGFDGFKIGFSQRALPIDTKATILGTPYYPVNIGGDTLDIQNITYNPATYTLTGPTAGSVKPQMWTQFLGSPISHQDGIFEVNCSSAIRLYESGPGVADWAVGEFKVGLSRPVKCATVRGDADDVAENIVNPFGLTVPGSDFTPYMTHNTNPGEEQMENRRNVWELVVNTDPDNLKLQIFGMFNDNVAGGQAPPVGNVMMMPIHYWLGTGGTRPPNGGATDEELDLNKYYANGSATDPAGAYAAEIESFRFTIKNECSSVEFKIKGDATWYVLISDTETSHRAGPMGMNRWAMYPKIMMGRHPHAGVATECQIASWFGRNMAKDFTNVAESLEWATGTQGDYLKTGSWLPSFRNYNHGYSELGQGATSPVRNVDNKLMCDYGEIRAGNVVLPDTTETGYLGGTGEGFDWGLVCGPYNDLEPFILHPVPNIKKLLGFNEDLILFNNGFTFSAGPPSSSILNSNFGAAMTAHNTLFVRLNNTSQLSFNAGKSSISKIVYHIPQFNQIGQSTGALFFESPEKTYLNVNNPEPVTLNDMRVDIVDQYEKYASSLVGNTVVCFHVIGPADQLVGKS